MLARSDAPKTIILARGTGSAARRRAASTGQFGGDAKHSAALEKQSPGPSAELEPEKPRAHASQQYGADQRDFLILLEMGRVAMDLDAQGQGPDFAAVNVGQLGHDALVQWISGALPGRLDQAQRTRHGVLPALVLAQHHRQSEQTAGIC